MFDCLGQREKVGKIIDVTKVTTGEMCRQKLLTHTFPDGIIFTVYLIKETDNLGCEKP